MEERRVMATDKRTMVCLLESKLKQAQEQANELSAKVHNLMVEIEIARTMKDRNKKEEYDKLWLEANEEYFAIWDRIDAIKKAIEKNK